MIDVVAAVLQRSDGTFLLAQRPVGKVYAGYWEFPGGKIEQGESPLQALYRELDEELGISVTGAYPWLLRQFTYPHASVRLHFFRVTTWHGEPHGRENQELSWQRLPELSVAPLLPANTPVLRALSLPNVYAITNATALGCNEFMLRLERALNSGLKLLQVREKAMKRDELEKFSRQVVRLAHQYGARVLINGDIRLVEQAGADGVHYTAAQLLECAVRPCVDWCSVSCHSEAELQQAEALGFDTALLSPVLPTSSHPGAPHLGWEKFATLTAYTGLPVYALGGLSILDMEVARQHGAQGIALLSQAW